MGIQINGNTNNINAGIGSLSIEDLNELDIIGVATAANFKTGVSNLHDVGLTLSGGQIDVGSNIKLGNAGVITATSFSGDGSNLTGLPSQVTISNNADNRVITGGSGTNLNGEANLTFDGSTLLQFTGTTDPKIRLQSAESGSKRLDLWIDGGEAIGYIAADQSASQLAFRTTGNERLRITSAGLVGIGNDNPSNALDVQGGTSNTAIVARSTDAKAQISLLDNSTTSVGSVVIGAEGDALFLTSGSGGTERLRIKSDGKIDIGGSTRTGNAARLTVTHTNSSGVGLIDIDAYGSATLQIRSNWSGSTINGMPNETFGFGTPHQYPLVFTTHGTERFRIASNGKIGINNASPECRGGGIDMSSNVGTSGKSFTDLRGESQLIIRNPSTTQHSFTQLLFENGGGTSAATMFRHRLGSSQGSLQNFVGDLCLFRRTGNAGGANNDYRESTRWCGSNVQARQIWWAYGDSDTSNTNRLGWHHLSAQRDHPGTDAYSFFRLETGAASYARQGWGKYTCAWTTGHASGYGLATGHFGYYMHHGNSRIYVNEHIIYRERYSNGSYYGWDDGPNLRICNSTESGGTNACIVFRAGGRRYSGGYDMSVMVGLFIDLYVPESANGDSNPRLYVAGDSQSNLDGGGHGSPVNHDYVSFQSSNPNHSGQP